MPYSGPDDKNLPDHVKKLDPKLRAQWVEIWNSVYEKTEDEGEATRQANGVIARRNEMAEIVIFPIAKLDTGKYGKVDFGDDFAGKILEHFENKVLKIDPVIDSEHEGGKAMGWVKRLFRSTFKRDGKDLPCVKAEIEWTAEGKESIKGRLFKYFSPVIDSYKDEETGKRYYPVLTGGALTNTPVLKLMPEVALSESGGIMKIPIEIPLYFEDDDEAPDPGASLRKAIEAIDAFLAEGGGAIKNKRGAPVARTILREARAKLSRYLPKEMGGDGKDPNERSDKMKLTEIAENLGLEFTEDASDEDIKAKLKEFSEAHSKAEKDLAEAKAKVEDLEKGDGDKEKALAELTKNFTELEKKLLLNEGWHTITQAMSEGKLLPAQAGMWAERFLADPTNTKKLIEGLAPVIDLSERGSDGSGPEGEALDQEVEKVMSERKVEYDEALEIVMDEKPELATQYVERGGK